MVLKSKLLNPQLLKLLGVAGIGMVSRVAAGTKGPGGGSKTNNLGPRTVVAPVIMKSRKSRTLSGIVAEQVRKQASAKHFALGDAALLQTMLHNTYYSYMPTSGVVQGDTNAQRDGDSVYLEALKIRGSYTTNSAANGYTCRVLVGWTGEELSVAQTFVAGSITPQMIYLPTTGANGVNGIINPKGFTLLYDETVDVNSQIAATTDISTLSAIIPLKQKFVYQESASAFGKTKNLVVVVISSVNGGVAGTTGTGVIAMSVDLIFKNL